MDFSIVTPTFKQPDWLRLCAASVLDQEGVTVEHIIQDGGDGRGLESLKNKPSVRVCVGKDRGMYDAVTKGISRATGSIVAHLNSDEQYLPGALKQVKQFFDTHPDVEVLFGDAILVGADGTPLSYRRIILPRRSHTIACQLGTLTSSTFFRRSLIGKRLIYRPVWTQNGDAALVLRWLKAGVKMATLPRPLSVFTFTGVNMSTGPEPGKENNRFLALLRAKGALGPLDNAPLQTVHHRFRKFLNGAYRPRNIEIDIFTRTSPNERQKIRALKLGFGWPSTA
jgi:glycosyltransferase involved in cell wall biosynthesis